MRGDERTRAGRIAVGALSLACLGAGAAMATDAPPAKAPPAKAPPAKAPPAKAPPAKAGAKPSGKVHVYDTNRINVNTASRSELMKLEGVSAATAEKIVAYRETHGRFKRLQDVQKVAGRGVVQMNAGRLTVK